MDFESAYRMTVGGELLDGETHIDVVNPATGKAFAKAPNCSAAQLDKAVAAAKAAFPGWRKTPIAERQRILAAAADLLEANAAEIGRLFTREQGRPVEGALAEVGIGIAWLRAHSVMQPPAHRVDSGDGQIIETHYVPLGVVGAISPWNFPINLSIWKIAPALLAGNTVVLKPSPFTPLCMLKIGELLNGILPAGVLNIITGDDGLGPLMTAHPGFAKISLTGSTATGKKVMEAASKDLKRVTLELGGNDAAIVLPDANVDEVAARIFYGAFFNSAQICIATKRLYIHEAIYDRMRDKLLEIAKATKVGDGSEQGTDLGPIQNQRQFERVTELIEDARASGLVLLEGSAVPEQGFFVPVTLVDNPPEDSRVVREEAFGPVLPLLKFRDIDDVIARANDSEYGLAGAVWSADIEQAKAVARRLETGTVWVNSNLMLRPDVPFAGHKQSGLGVENGIEGLLEYMAPQAVYFPAA